MNHNDASVDLLLETIDRYLEAGDYEKADEAIQRICQQKHLPMADAMPEDFLLQLKKKENVNMKRSKLSRHTVVIAASIAAILLIGGSVSATVLRNGSMHTFDYGLTDGEISTESGALPAHARTPQKLEEESRVKGPVKEEANDASQAWTSKKTWDETETFYASEDAVNWEKETESNRITEISYKTYDAAVKDVGFADVFKERYDGSVVYREYEHLDQEAPTDRMIEGAFSYGNGRFELKQRAETDADQNEHVLIVGQTSNEREYVTNSGIRFCLSDTTQDGKIKTTTMMTGKQYYLILSFTDLTEEEIHQILETVVYP